MSRDGWRPQIESALSIDIWRMDRAGSLRDGTSGGLQWARDGERLASVGYSVALHDTSGVLTLRYTCENRDYETETVTCTVRLSSVPLHFGGRRWYGHCPYTGRQARKLYKFHGVNQFCHRTAIRPLPTYLSQRLSGMARIQHQRWAIRRKLGDEFSSLLGNV